MCRAEPHVPIEGIGNGIFSVRARHSLGPMGTVGPNVEFQRFADHTGLDDLNSAAQPGGGAALIAHLCGQFIFPGQLPHHTRFVDGLNERLLAKRVFAHLHRSDRCDAMVVVRCRNCYRINVFADFIEHFAIIFELLEIWKFCGELFGFAIEGVLIHVADGHDVAAAPGGVTAVHVSFSTDADASDVDAFIGAQNPAHIGEGKRGGTHGQCRFVEELPAREWNRLGKRI